MHNNNFKETIKKGSSLDSIELHKRLLGFLELNIYFLCTMYIKYMNAHILYTTHIEYASKPLINGMCNSKNIPHLLFILHYYILFNRYFIFYTNTCNHFVSRWNPAVLQECADFNKGFRDVHFITAILQNLTIILENQSFLYYANSYLIPNAIWR